MPTSPDPGTTSSSCSLKTLASGPLVKRAVSACMPLAIICVPIDPFGRTHRVDQHDLFDPIDEVVLDLSGPHDAGRVHHLDRGHVVLRTLRLAFVECTDERLGEAVADDRQPIHSVALDCFEHLVSFEAACGEVDDVRAPEHRDEPAQPASGAVHHWGAGGPMCTDPPASVSCLTIGAICSADSGNSIPSSG